MTRQRIIANIQDNEKHLLKKGMRPTIVLKPSDLGIEVNGKGGIPDEVLEKKLSCREVEIHYRHSKVGTGTFVEARYDEKKGYINALYQINEVYKF